MTKYQWIVYAKHEFDLGNELWKPAQETSQICGKMRGKKLGCREITEVMDKGFYFPICKCEETGPEGGKYK